MSGKNLTIFSSLLAATVALSMPAVASPAGLSAGKPGAPGAITLVGHSHGGGGWGGGGGGGGPHFSGRSSGMGSMRFHSSPRFSNGIARGPVRFSNNWSNHGGRHHHRHHGYPFITYYGGGYYPYYDDYYEDDYSNDDDACYYSRRYRTWVCPDE